MKTVDDRDLLIAFATLCAAVLSLAVVLGLAFRIFVALAGFGE
jgi:hypothetical protein